MWVLSEKVTLEGVSQNNPESRRTSPERSHIFVYLVKIKILFRYIIKPFKPWRPLQNIHTYKKRLQK